MPMINNLRNHDQPCRHGELWHHAYQIVPEVLWCPGGAAVDIDYEAAADQISAGRWDDGREHYLEVAHSTVDAALGLTDE